MASNEDYRQAFRAEVAWLLDGLTFTAGRGRFVGGRLAAVEFVAEGKPRRGECKVGLRIIAAGVRPDVPNAVVAQARQQLEAHLAGANEQTRPAAQAMLDRLRSPRPLPEDLRGWRL